MVRLQPPLHSQFLYKDDLRQKYVSTPEYQPNLTFAWVAVAKTSPVSDMLLSPFYLVLSLPGLAANAMRYRHDFQADRCDLENDSMV